MATDPATIACPVCSEPLEQGASRCFRCESDLTPWRRFEGKLSAIEQAQQAATTAVRAPVQTQRLAWGPVVAAGVAGLALGLVVNQGEDAQKAPVVAPVAHSVTLAPAPPATVPSQRVDAQQGVTVRLVVQEGDSLWRLSKTLTGRGASWRELWPEMSEIQAKHLKPRAELLAHVPPQGGGSSPPSP